MTRSGNHFVLAIALWGLTGCAENATQWRWPVWGENTEPRSARQADAADRPRNTTRSADAAAASARENTEPVGAANDPGSPAAGLPDSPQPVGNASPLPRSVEELRRGKVIPADMVMINDQPLTVEDVLEPIVPYLRKRAGRQDAETSARTRFEQVKAVILGQQDYILLYQEYGPRVTEQEEKQYKKFAEEEIKKRINEEFGGRQARYERYLQSLGLSLDKVLEKRKRQLVVLKNLQDSFRPLVRPPRRKELKQFYEANRSRFHRPVQVEFCAIEAAFDDFREAAEGKVGHEAKEAMRAAARKHIEAARGELASGLPFEVVARQYSGGGFRLKGGYWGTISAPIPIERLRQASEVALSLQSGQVSDVIEGPDAFYLVRCGKRIEAETISFEEIQPDLTEQFENAQYERLVLRKKIELRRKARVSEEGLKGLMLKALERLDVLLEPNAAATR